MMDTAANLMDFSEEELVSFLSGMRPDGYHNEPVDGLIVLADAALQVRGDRGGGTDIRLDTAATNGVCDCQEETASRSPTHARLTPKSTGARLPQEPERRHGQEPALSAYANDAADNVAAPHRHR